MGSSENLKLPASTYLYSEESFDDFELHFKFRINSEWGNSGVQYRSRVNDPKAFTIDGYQADIESGERFNGILYEVGGRKFMASRGEKLVIDKTGKKSVVGKTCDAAVAQKAIKNGEWNDYVVVAYKNKLRHIINGFPTIEVEDNEPGKGALDGILAFQMHQGPEMNIQFKDLKIRKLSAFPEPPAVIETSTNVPAKDPMWIWTNGSLKAEFKKNFTLKSKPTKAMLNATCDNGFTLFINGSEVARSDNWQAPLTSNVAKYLKAGANEIIVSAYNIDGLAGFVCHLDAGEKSIYTDGTWMGKAPDGDWKQAVEIEKYGSAPWKKIIGDFTGRQVVSDTSLDLLPGFEAELLYSVDQKTQGSWISMTFDDKGRMITTAEKRNGLYRLTFPKAGQSGKTKVELLPVKDVKDVRGLLYAFDSLYVATNGVHRLQDTTGDDQFDTVTKILDDVTSQKAHGSHAMIVSADGKAINFINGNFSKFNNNMPSRQPPVWAEDSLLPHFKVGHANDVRAPGAWVCRFDPDGKNPVMLASGMRNPCDISLNKDGELFTYDADMEYDMGNAWYRPTRVNHLTSGSEFGWRTGSQKWPEYYADSLGSVVDIGPGSPTGIVFGTKTAFPERYRDCLYLCDWSYGVLYAVHMEEQGASYTGTKEAFATKAAFPLVDVEVGPNGDLYVMTGGWGNQSEIYRIRYTGKASVTSSAPKTDSPEKQLRELRRTIESFHHNVGVTAVDENWKHLSHSDRHIRYAARIAIENQSLELWQEKVFIEENPVASIQAVIALIRHGDKAMLDKAVNKLNAIDFEKLDKAGKLGLLRAYGLMFARWGQPSEAIRQGIITKIDPNYPSNDSTLNEELCTLMSYLDAPSVVGKTISLIQTEEAQLAGYFAKFGKDGTLKRSIKSYGKTVEKLLKNKPNPHKGHYLYALKSVTKGWTLDYRKQYFTALKESMALSGGHRYHFFMERIKESALENTAEEHKRLLEFLLKKADKAVDIAALPKAKGPGKVWTSDEVDTLVKEGLKGRNFEQGKRMFGAAHCFACHQFNGGGGVAGPDLSNLGRRFSVKDIMDSINEPSKVINAFYEATNITLKDGSFVYGQVIEKTETELKIMTNPYDTSNLTSVKLSEIEERKVSHVSQMPPMMTSMFNKEELLDFMAYILSQGNHKHAYFKK